ncbi:hypothetical protein [Thalassotalea sp. SU-HH00458]|uniref:hypothetical protein n=1 Tax=Thalassotalea sp. SU-HH00458 TaxID=3127657 RepID=UPI00310B5D71
MDSSTPFYQQLTARFYAIFSLFIFSLTLALLLFHYRDQQVNFLLQEQLPGVEKSYRSQEKYIKINNLISNVLQSDNAKNFLKNHQNYLEQLKELKKLSTKKSRFIEQVILSETAELENIKRLTNNHQRNQLLKQSSVIQLQLVLDELNSELADNKAKQVKLLQQINQDNVADKVTVSRAKAHANLTNIVNLLQQTALAVKNVEILFSRLDLQYSLVDFNFYTDELLQSLDLWQSQFQAMEESKELSTPLLTVMFKLNQLLFVEQNAIAKWRGQLRLSQEYFQRLTEQQTQWQQFRPELQWPTTTIKPIPSFIEKALNDKIRLTDQQWQFVIFTSFALLIFLFAILLLQLKKRVKQQGLASIDYIKNIASGNESVASELVTREDKQIAEIVLNTVHPSHSEADYQVLLAQLRSLEQVIFEHAQLAFYVLNEEKNAHANALAKQLIFSEQSKHNKQNKQGKQSWQQAFAYSSLKTLIKTARIAERDNVVGQCDVYTRFNQLLTITIVHHNSTWQGTVRSNAQQAKLVDELDRLKQQLAIQDEKYQHVLRIHTEKLDNMLIRTMLQSQSVSIGSGVTSLQVYRQLTRILQWNRQLQINIELQRVEQRKTLVDVDTRNELMAICQNVMIEANQQRNTVQLAVDNRVLSRAKVNVSLFHQTLESLANLCLLEQFNATLLLNAEIADKNSGQQIIRFTFNVLVQKPKATLPELIAALIEYEGQENTIQKVQYLHTLLTASYSKNLQANATEKGFQLSVDMPMAFVENDANKDTHIHEVELIDKALIVVGERNAFTKSIETHVKTAQGRVESIEQVEHLVKQLNVKHLTSNKVSAVIITGQVFKNEGHVITQHLSTLPKPLTPKLIVLQSPFTHALHHEGFYEKADAPCEVNALIKYLAEFIQSKRVDNLIIPAEIFNQYRFCSTQVEVLLGVESVDKYQFLSRLLHWLGFQVRIVCHADTMLEQWQTGRYLVLLTEFKHSPFVQMKVGKNVSRGVFSLGESPLKKATKQELLVTKSWSQAQVKNVLDVQQLVKLFSPWLKEKQLALSTEQKTKISKKVTAHVTSHKATNLPTAKDKKVANDADISRIDNLLSVKEGEVEQAFDLNLYALNQGSPELAVFMLDEYMADINEAIAEICKAIDDKAFESALLHTAEIEKVTTILAAKNLNESAKALTLALNKKALPEVNAKLKLLTQQYQTLTEFVQNI